VNEPLPTSAFPPGRWRARWIWADPASADGDVPERHTVALRTTVALDAVPAVVSTRLVSVSRHVLLINGVEVARGPVRANPRRQPYDTVDLAPHLRPGTNEIAVLAWRYPGPMAWYLPVPIANDLGRGAVVLEGDLGDGRWLTTDASWVGTVLEGWTADAGVGISARGAERVDARSLPEGWAVAPVTWPAVIERSARTTGDAGRREPPSYPIGPLVARTTTASEPDRVELSRSSSDVFLADRVVVGTLEVDLDGPPGGSITVQPAELLDGQGLPAPTEHDSAVVVTVDGSPRSVETLEAYGLRGLTVAASGGASVRSIAVRERLHPVTGDASFECSDPMLTDLWSVGRRTVSICSLDSYVDCPTREQRAWTGDSVVHQMVDLTTNADWTLARWHPRLTASPRADGMLPMAVAGDIEAIDFTIIPDWSLHWVHSVWNLYRYVGDRDEVASLLPVAEGVLRWFEPFCDADGVPTDVYGWVIIDWASVYAEGVSAALCGLWGRALLELAEMAEWLDDRGRAAWARAAHHRLAAGFERLWDPARRRYVDSWIPGADRPMASQHGQAAAIVGGLAPVDRHDRLVEVITNADDLVHASFSIADGPSLPGSETPVGSHLRQPLPEPWWDVDRQVVRAQPFFRYVVHDALTAAGRADLIATQLLDWGWALDRCPTSLTETWYGGTVSHGWSATPTRDLVQRILGVTPAEPGFGVASVAPALGHLGWARGRVPTPAGMLDIEVRRDGLTVDSPVPFEHGGRRLAAGRHTLAVESAS